MMAEYFRETAMGQLIRYATNKRYLKYPEELPGFLLPESYLEADKVITRTTTGTSEDDASDTTSEHSGQRRSGEQDASPYSQRRQSEQISTQQSETQDEITPAVDPEVDIEKQERLNQVPTRRSSAHGYAANLSRTKTREDTLPFTGDRMEAERIATIERTATRPIAPRVTNNGEILVTWYTTDDAANPQNWTSARKNFAAFILCVYTFAVYSGSSIYAPAEGEIQLIFGVSASVSALGLSMYVLGYGVGPLLFSPLSEIAWFGRNPIYVITFFIFTMLAIPAALVNNVAGLIVLRFLQGFFGSPCLATAGASFQDMYSFVQIPYIFALWAAAAYCGPSTGPVMSGFAVSASWRWSMWEILIISAPLFILMLLCLPETSEDNILYRRAARLRALTGNDRLKSASEIKQGNTSFSDVVIDALIKPLQITLLDPAVLFVNVYISFIYGTYYSFFEAFPLVYTGIYGMNVGEVSITFLNILVACVIAVAIYYGYLYFYLGPDMQKNGLRAQEFRLRPALAAVFLPTIGLFLFAWTSRSDIHWIVSIIGIFLFSFGVFFIFQCVFVYIPMSYPQYAASLFAANDFLRSALASGAVIFARPLYINLGIGRGVSLLGGLSVLGILGMFFLYFFGDKLRARSRFTIKA